MKLNLSTKSYIGLVLILAILSSISIFLPQGQIVGQYELPASKPIMALASFSIILVLYGGLGFIGLKLSKKLGFAEIWNKNISSKKRFVMPALIGIGLGIFFILADLIFSKFHAFGALPHPPFPISLIASATAGIGEEIIFRLFFISFWVWLISYVILKKKCQNQIFWIVSVFSAFAFAFGHLPSIMALFNLTSISQVPLALMIEIILLNGALSLFAASCFRKYGFLAAVGIHFWTDIIWHVIYGIL
ncbi:MAG: CPBP family glutamic-type intramembrane protease [Candidatus Woesearchaeota archaeon]|nr:CPBP family glutamic-type intramembrane protease [Candidatus Woesearchaeota archaeon]